MSERIQKYINCISIKFYYKFFNNNYVEFEEFNQDVYVYVLEHLDNYDKNKCSINTYLYLLVELFSKNYYRKFKAKKRSATLISIDEDNKINMIKTYDDNKIFSDDLIKFILKNTKEKNKEEVKIIINALIKGYNVQEIVKICKSNRSTIDRRIKRIKEIIKEY